MLASRERINRELVAALDASTRPWGIKVNRVELKSVEPPAAIQEAMERERRAERDKRAAIAAAEATKQAAILTAEGEKQAALLRTRAEAEGMVLRAKAEAEARAVRAQAEVEAIALVFKALHQGEHDPQLLAYQYLQALPQIAAGEANTAWVVPDELGKALEGLGEYLANRSRERGGTNG